MAFVIYLLLSLSLLFPLGGGWERARLLEYKQFAQAIALLAQHQTSTHLHDVAFEQRLRVAVVVDANVSGRALVEAVFQGDVVDDALACVHRFTTRTYLSSDDEAYAIAPETFRKAEAIVGLRTT